MRNLKLKLSLATVGLLSLIGLNSFATAPDFSSLTAAVDFSTVGVAVLAVLAGVAGVMILWAGGKMIVRAIKSA